MTLLDTAEATPATPDRVREIEPRVLTVDVQRILKRVVKPDNDDVGDSVTKIARAAETSTRTVYRVLAATSETLSLDLADRLCLAADAHLSECRLEWPNGHIQGYLD